ncbi:MAG: glycerophosphodiester phosphodiesterase [Candidatus Nomurabacteria bacterium]|jgi:glycerophosphoryl diester phosphodiesterase|nr:glycerophosphodiester phosphodiesterase [Candidatus Nomurabacteria bacterium]
MFFVYAAAKPLAPKSTMSKSVKASSKNHVMLIAHRGGSPKHPESSLSAYYSAISSGSIFLEPDIVPSKDGVLFVTHDNNLKHLTGKNITVSKTTSKKLDRIKLRNGERLMRLSEMFNNFGDDVFYVVEPKSYYVSPRSARKMDKKLIKLIKKYGLEKRVMIQSQSMSSLKFIHSKLRSVPYMYITQNVKVDLIKKIKSLPSFIDVVSVPYVKASKSVLRVAHKSNIKVALYTIKDKSSMKKAMRHKPDIIFTDNVKLSIKYLKGG